jgi:hypothetical protein
VFVKDNAGNIGVGYVTAYYDDSAPTVAPTANPSGWTNQSITITPNATDPGSNQSLVDTGSYRYASGHIDTDLATNYANAATFTGTFSVSAYGGYTVFVKDNAGNIGVGYVTAYYDDSAPTVAPTANPSGWTNQSITITPNATDPGSNQSLVDTGSYRYASGHIDTNLATNYASAATFTGTFSVSAYGGYTVFVKDNAGNIGVGYVTAYYDDSAPTVAPTANPSGWTNQSITITPNATDPGSNQSLVDTGSYRYASGHIDTNLATNYASAATFTGTFSVSVYGEYTVFAKDSAGNIGVGYVNAYYDSTAPVINDVTSNPLQTVFTNATVTLNVNATDASGSGIEEYSFDNGITWQTSNSKSFGANGDVNIKVKDAAGNISNTYTFNIHNIVPTYSSGGFQSPVSSGDRFKRGSVIPFKFDLRVWDGSDVSGLTPKIMVQLIDTNTGTLGDPVEVITAGNANTDNYFRYADGKFIYNLSTKNLPAGHYMVTALVGATPVTSSDIFLVR